MPLPATREYLLTLVRQFGSLSAAAATFSARVQEEHLDEKSVFALMEKGAHEKAQRDYEELERIIQRWAPIDET